MRLDSGINKNDINYNDFEQMLASNSGLPLPQTNADMRKQTSLGGQSFFNMLQNNIPMMGMGDTGTTPRNELYSNLMMNKGANISYDMRAPGQNAIISPWMDSANRRSILNPTPLRHNPSFMSNTNSILRNPDVPNFGGGDNS